MSKLLGLIIIIQSRGGQLRNFEFSVKFVNLRNVQANQFYLNTFRKIYVHYMSTEKVAPKPQNSLITNFNHTKWQSLMKQQVLCI